MIEKKEQEQLIRIIKEIVGLGDFCLTREDLAFWLDERGRKDEAEAVKQMPGFRLRVNDELVRVLYGGQYTEQTLFDLRDEDVGTPDAE